MRYSIVQTGDTTWELRAADGTVVATYHDRPGNTGYDQACTRLGTLLAEDRNARLAAGDPVESIDGLLPERWVSDAGIAFSEDTAGGRDFSECAWSWRDPTASLVPLMLQTSSEYGHMGAELAGFVEEFHMDGTTPGASGRFYDNEYGVQFRDLLLGGRRFGVSVDPSENVVVEYSDTCLELDEDGFCAEWDFSVVFKAYEIGGLTGTPFPCFENASIVLDATAGAASTVPPVRASAPTRPPRAWLSLPEPRLGQPFLGGLGDDVLVPQRDRYGDVVAHACPLTINPDGFEGLVFGHLTYFGQCHIGDPWGPGICASAAPSTNGYAEFHTGTVVCEDGSVVPTGPLTVGCEHSDAFTAQGVRDHMAHAGMGWADVHVVDGELGVWFSGVLRPGITDDQLRVLRSLSLSGEWVGDLAAALLVNASGLPLQRLAASAVSAFARTGFAPTIPTVALRASARPNGVTKVVGANIVRDCPECGRTRLEAGRGRYSNEDVMGELRAMRQQLRTIGARTLHLIDDELAARRARLTKAP